MVTQPSSEELSIKVIIADRPYPLKVNVNEEEVVRKAAKLVNEKINKFKDTYAADKQDLLAMCALMLAIDNLKGESNLVIEDQSFIEKIDEIDNIAEKLLAKQDD